MIITINNYTSKKNLIVTYTLCGYVRYLRRKKAKYSINTPRKKFYILLFQTTLRLTIFSYYLKNLRVCYTYNSSIFFQDYLAYKVP